MKKMLALLLAVLMVLSLAACGDSAPAASTATAAPTATEAPAAEATAEPEAAPAAEASGSYCSDAEPVVNLYGEFTADSVQDGILVTNIGQSADTATLASLLKRGNVAYEENDTAAEGDLAGFGTLIVVAGASTKGLGSAGISQEDEMARAESLLSAAKEAGMTIVLAHLGGSGRRGNTSDLFIDIVREYADYMLVVEDGNMDGYFTSFCEANNIPLTLVKSAKNASDTVAALFG